MLTRVICGSLCGKAHLLQRTGGAESVWDDMEGVEAVGDDGRGGVLAVVD